MNINNNFETVLKYLDDHELYPKFEVISKGVNEPVCVIGNRSFLQFAANNYLSLTSDKDVIIASINSLKKYGLGPGGSRVISGNVDIIEKLEKEIADLTGTESCITFPTGYMANVAVFRALMDPFLNDSPYSSESSIIFSDELNHGSIVDGCRLSDAKKSVFRHDDLDDLYRLIKENKDKPHKIIVTEGVFSLEGEIINLPKYVEIAKETNSLLMVDDAHGVGILGEYGGGTPQHFNCAKEIDILMGCMDKAMGGTGGYLCGSERLIKYLRISARPSLLSSAIPTGMAGGMLESIKKIRTLGEARKDIFDKALHLRGKLKSSGFRVLGNDNIPAVPLFLGDENIAINFSRELFENGIYLPVVRWPAVPLSTARLRIILMTSHTYKQIDQLINICFEAGKKVGLLGI